MTKPRALRCVVDTNVAATANGDNDAASPECVSASAHALYRVMREGHLFVDDGGLIVAEYRAHLSPRGQPGPGDAFLRWVLTHEWGGRRVTRVPVTPVDEAAQTFAEFTDPEGVTIDPSDRKFFAVAAAHPERPSVLQSLDSKWWGWRDALKAMGIAVEFICEADIGDAYGRKQRP